MIIKAKDNTYVKIEGKQSEVIDLGELQESKTRFETRLSEINGISDEQLLVWAKENYPNGELLIERDELITQLADINAKLEEINNIE